MGSFWIYEIYKCQTTFLQLICQCIIYTELQYHYLMYFEKYLTIYFT